MAGENMKHSGYISHVLMGCPECTGQEPRRMNHTIEEWADMSEAERLGQERVRDELEQAAHNLFILMDEGRITGPPILYKLARRAAQYAQMTKEQA